MATVVTCTCRIKEKTAMKQQIVSQEEVSPELGARGLINDSRDVWPVCGAGIGLIGGVLAPLLGALFTFVSWFEGNSGFGPSLHRLGTISFLLTIPLLIFGGYCLDVLEKRGWKFR